jgi:glycosyltransferase involved in cell wall biosynthesis
MARICFFISSISPSGGTERVCTTMANALAIEGHQVSIVSIYGNSSYFPLSDSIKILSVFQAKKRFKIIPAVLLKLRSIFSQLKPNVLISVDSAVFVYAFTATLGLKINNLVWEHFNFHVSLSRIRPIARKLAAKYSVAIITLTQEDKKAWESNISCKVPIIAIPNPSPFPPLPKIKEERVVLAVGRLTYQKGFDRLLDAWQSVQVQLRADWKLRIVGSGELAQQLRQQVKKLQLQDSVELLPSTKAVEMHYEQAAIYCLPSRFEGFPMVLLEAQSFALPIVAYDCKTGPAEIVTKQSGILVEEGNIEALADALQLLMQDQTQRQEMSRHALSNASRYTLDSVLTNWKNLLDSFTNA